MTNPECACRHKDTPRDEAFQKNLQKRLNRAIGQLGGVKSMIDDNRYCGDVLMQLAAAEKAVHRVSELPVALTAFTWCISTAAGSESKAEFCA